jgi:tetratricopeptide (TPR) repeat protein
MSDRVLGVAFGEHGEFDKGKDILNQALRKKPNSALLFHGLGIISLNQGKTDESINLFEKALQCESTYWRANLLISEAYKSKSDFAKAFDHNLRAIKLMPSLNNFYQFLVSIFLRYSLLIRTLNIIMLTFLLFSKSLLYIPLAILSMGITLLISSIFFKRRDRKLGIVVIVLGLIPICWYIVRIIPSS